MNYEIISYDVKVQPLHRAVCKIVVREQSTYNVIGIILNNHDQVRELMDQLKVYANPAPSWGMTGKQLDDMTKEGGKA